MDAAEYADLGEGAVAGARKAGVWDRLGPITRVVFERVPQVRLRVWPVARTAAISCAMQVQVQCCTGAMLHRPGALAWPPPSPALLTHMHLPMHYMRAGGAGVGGCCDGS